MLKMAETVPMSIGEATAAREMLGALTDGG